MAGRPVLTCFSTACVLSLLLVLPVLCWAQDDTSLQSSPRSLEHQVGQLDSPSYRARQLAQWKLGQNPEEAIPLLRSAIVGAGHNAGAQMIDLLTEFALSQNVTLSIEALEILRSTSGRINSVGKMAENALSAIAYLQEEQAIEILLHHGAIIGPREFSLHGQLAPAQMNEDALYINDSFTGNEETIRWIPFLKSIETVCLEGPKIDASLLELVVQMSGLRNIKLKSVRLTMGDLRVLHQLTDLQHLGLVYVNVDDSDVDALGELPVSSTMKLYGTKITAQGFERLQQQMEDVDFYFGRGGFLGVSPVILSGTQINTVTQDSAAHLAGIVRGDIITEINGVQVKTFAELRGVLGEYGAGETIEIKLIRRGLEMTVEATLKEES